VVVEGGNVLHHVKNRGGIVQEEEMSGEYIRGNMSRGAKCPDPAQRRFDECCVSHTLSRAHKSNGLVVVGLLLLDHILDVTLVWRKENKENKMRLCVTVACTIIMVHKDTSIEVDRLYRALIVLGLAPCLPSASVSS